jgi:hypothetical protein
MFRRRTDQVYSTLQQVQRRITEQSGQAPEQADIEPSVTTQPVVNLQPLSQALPSGGVVPTQSALNPAPAAAPFAGVQTNRLGPAGNRYVLQVSGDLAMLLVVIWLISMALMFVLGQHWRSSGGAGLAPGPAGNRDTATAAVAPGKRQGDWIYVLLSQTTATVEATQFFEERARNLNEFVRQNANRGWKPYFSVRKPVNGGIELAFGYADGVWGIDQAEFVAFAKILAEPQPKGGGFASARWVKVDP